MGSFEEAAKLVPKGGSTIRAVSDFCPVMQIILKLKFPEARIHKMSRGILEHIAELQDRLEVLVFSLPCVAFSTANLQAKGTRDSLFAPNLVDTIEAIKKLRPLTFFLESAPGIALEFQGDRSVVTQLQEELKEYRLDVFRLESSEALSPLVSNEFERSPMRKKSLIILGYVLNYFSEITEKTFLEEKTSELGSFEHVLDPLGRESEYYEQMPLKDQEALEFNPHVTKAGVFVIGNVCKPTAGRGEANFPNEVVDPSLGAMPCNTTAGSLWIGVECPREEIAGLGQRVASIRRMSTLESLRALGVRGFDNPTCLEVLQTFPAAARRMVGNAPAQPLYDLAACQLQRNMSLVQPDGKSAWEKWDAKKEKKRVTRNEAAAQSGQGADQQFKKLQNSDSNWVMQECPRGHLACFHKAAAKNSLCDDCHWKDNVQATKQKKANLGALSELSTGARHRNTARKPETSKCQICNVQSWRPIYQYRH
jgi:hypothetical protein